MNNEIPMLNEQQRNEIMHFAADMLERYEEQGNADSNAAIAMKITIAALLAEPWVYRDSQGCFVTKRKGEKLLSEGELAIPLYNAPPIPALKLPDEMDTDHPKIRWVSRDDLFARIEGWNLCIEELKRLNEVGK